MTAGTVADFRIIFTHPAALPAGGPTGLDRAFHPRPAGVILQEKPARRGLTTAAGAGPGRDDIMATMQEQNIRSATPGNHMQDTGETMHYEFTQRGISCGNFELLADTPKANPKISQFSLAPSGELRVRTRTTA